MIVGLQARNRPVLSVHIAWDDGQGPIKDAAIIRRTHANQRRAQHCSRALSQQQTVTNAVCAASNQLELDR